VLYDKYFTYKFYEVFLGGVVVSSSTESVIYERVPAVLRSFLDGAPSKIHTRCSTDRKKRSLCVIDSGGPDMGF
jgi:hypothetical protein